MPTQLNRPVTRKTRGSYAVLYRKPRPIVVTLCLGDYLEFREHGRRTKFQLPLDTAFRSAIHAKARADAADKRAKRKAKL